MMDKFSRRKKLGYTGEFIADGIGVSRSHVILIENGMAFDCYYHDCYEKILAELERERLRELVNQYPEETLKVVAEDWLALRHLS